MEFWKLLTGLQGKILKTLAQGRTFEVLHVGQSEVIIVPHRTMKPRHIPMKEIEGSYQKLKAIGQITRVEIEAEYSPRDPAYVASILAALPGVRHNLKTIITLEL